MDDYVSMDPNTDSFIPNGADHGAPIPWQTVYFLLVAVATSTVAQPCGRVSGFSKRYGLYLRISPIVCALDAASVILYFVSGSITGASPRSLIRNILDHRFDEDADKENQEITESTRDCAAEDIASEVQGVAEILHDIRKDTFYRWLAFLFGGLLPTIKLVALIGVPTSKAWGLMFSVSFVVIEMLIVASGGTRNKSSQRRDVSTVSNPTSNWTLNHTFRAVTVLGIFTQILVFLWAATGILDRVVFGFNDNARYGITENGPNGSYTHWYYLNTGRKRDIFFEFYWDRSQIGFAMTVFVGCLLFHRVFPAHINHHRKLVKAGLGMFLIIYIIGFPLYGTYKIWWNRRIQNRAWYPLLLFPFGMIISALYFVLDMFNRLLPKVVKYLLPEKSKSVALSTGSGNFEEVSRILAVIFFFLHVLISLFWFAYVFNPRFTYNTGWTAVFG